MSDRDAAGRRTRRQFLAGASVAGAVGLAGCGALGGGGNGKETIVEGDWLDSLSNEPVDKESDGTLPTPVIGDPNADVVVMAFEDYACPHCAHYALEIFPDLASEYIEPGTIRYEHHEFPLPLTNASWRAPSAARAVQHTVGAKAYWTFSHSLFANQSNLGSSLYGDLAKKVGADPKTIKNAAAKKRFHETIKTDRQRGAKLGVRGTPTIFVNGTKLKRYDFETIKQAIESER
ncbi:MAG: DsbA family protein [Halapricum sp.]